MNRQHVGLVRLIRIDESAGHGVPKGGLASTVARHDRKVVRDGHGPNDRLAFALRSAGRHSDARVAGCHVPQTDRIRRTYNEK